MKGFEDLSALICVQSDATLTYVQSDAIYIHSIHVHDSTQAYQLLCTPPRRALVFLNLSYLADSLLFVYSSACVEFL